jgi:hypothetical protein
MNEPISLGVMPALARYAREAALKRTNCQTLVPIRSRVGAEVPAALAPQPRAERGHRHVVAETANIDHAMIIVAAPEAPRGQD